MIKFQIDIEEVTAELQRLMDGPALAEFESAMLQGFLVTQDKVHVITGYLKGSGHVTSQVGTGTWEGTIGFARYPGIYELARGNTPTMNHPEGEHYFFDPGGELFTDQARKVLEDWLTGGEGSAGDDSG